MSDHNSSIDNGGFREVLNMSIPAAQNSIAAVADAVADKLKDLSLAEEKQLEIGLAVQEALANAVVHGCNNNPALTVRCCMMSDHNGSVFIAVSDPGPGFDPTSPADPKMQENLHADHGRGIYLIRQLMDEVKFERGGKEIRMWKY